ncbi:MULTISPECIES: DUF2239 family protein [Methylocaldum]|jgi:hypothetical protein|uniref:DUF2239 family protein n=1 Tax=unclassified Methylocaldum TaxID=2622260 RepID=UPI00105F5489|nr:DUF2239 family protein [Methylocaldum sp. BRCS4]
MNTNPQPTWIAFAGAKRIALGPPRDVAAKVKSFVDTDSQDIVLIFDAVTSAPVELDLRGSVSAVLDRLSHAQGNQTEPVADTSASAPRTAGRPKLGVTAREVTLLPRHWEWLTSQPGGASVALRKLVEQAMRANRQDDQVRQAREAAYRFMNAMAGNEPGFEEAIRALFAGDQDRLHQAVAKWPADVRQHTLALTETAAVTRPKPETAPAD